MSEDRWQQLWLVAVGEPGEPATISVSPAYSDLVTLQWPDGSCASLHWHDGDRAWRWSQGPDRAPCDVSARDAL